MKNPLKPNPFETPNTIADDLWRKNFHNAKKFFESKGNLDTKDKLKKKWLDEFYEDLNDVRRALF